MARPRKKTLLEIEAEKYLEQKKLAPVDEARLDMFAAAALSGLLARSSGMVNLEDLKREAFDIAREMCKY
jgi:hypothetical protein